MGTLSLSAGYRTGEGLVADGRLINISSNEALFSLIGTTYGGDGRVTFALPDMSDITPNNMTWMICDRGIFPSTL
ncbi:tail fiber protein [Salinibacterium sp. NK8237]|nr:tail fiber protein [Salinibacterium sp. NK8237]